MDHNAPLAPVPPRVLVFGSLNADDVFAVPGSGPVLAGETRSSSSFTRFPGGKGANQAAAAARAGSVTQLWGQTGADAEGSFLRNTLSSLGVDVSSVLSSQTVPTGRAFIQIAQETAENAIVLFPGANRAITPCDIARLFQQLPSLPSAVMLQNETSCNEEVVTAAGDRGIAVVYNPSPFQQADFLAVMGCLRPGAVLLLNEIEAGQCLSAMRTAAQPQSSTALALAPHCAPGNADPTGAFARANALLDQLEPQIALPGISLVLTLGSAGAVASFPAGSARGRVAIPAAPVPEGATIVDTTGAGDCFAGFLVHGLATFGLLGDNTKTSAAGSPSPADMLDTTAWAPLAGAAASGPRDFHAKAWTAALSRAARASTLACTRHGAMLSFPDATAVDQLGADS